MPQEEFCRGCDTPINFGQFTRDGLGPFCTDCLGIAEDTLESDPPGPAACSPAATFNKTISWVNDQIFGGKRLMPTIEEQNTMGLNDHWCEDCGHITPWYVRKNGDPKCLDCRELHTVLHTRCKHGMIEVTCGYCMGDVTRRHDGIARTHDGSTGFGCSPTYLHMASFLMYQAYRLNSFRDGIQSEREFF
jgi:hypothetical protein